ncbi:ABC transporter permease [Paraclostridium sordellii]|uniref:ABC transporter permease n=1 Tax=Paraclostridium sordellii TaxID=1505 RepID=UPI0005E8D33C|nr:ribose ABC transporter permease [Paeniclostridium sordellii]CEQ20283.1 ribose ABC transporter [[Clostridium] sordellii] [Paeniclostridium sordellii]
MKSKRLNINIFDYGTVLFLVFLVLLFSMTTEYFFTFGNITNILRQISIVGISTVAMTMVIITGGIDLSVGSMLALSSILLAKMLTSGVSMYIAIPITLVVGILMGLINGFLINKIKISPLISTLGTMTIYRGITYIITGGLPVYGFPKGFSFIGQGYIGKIPVPIFILAGVYIVGFVILYLTKFGIYVYGIGGSEKASILSGIKVNLVRYKVYAISGFLSALAGVISLSRINSGVPNSGTGFELDVVTAVVLGGVSVSGGSGKLSGVIIGCLIIGILSNGMILLNIGEYYQMVVKGLVLLVAVGIDNFSKER